jgi:selenium metabolism protein YedF
MNLSYEILDARGLACPGPVILVKKALEGGALRDLEILVDNEAARENVLRFAYWSRCVLLAADKAEGAEGAIEGSQVYWRIRVRPAAGKVDEKMDEKVAVDDSRGAESPAMAVGTPILSLSDRGTVFIASDALGQGSEELGRLLMRGFLYALTERETVPERVILMNSGVRLAVAGSESLVNLKKLGERGVEILVCGTCLEYFGVREDLAVGRISNMYELAGFLMEGGTLRI